MSVCVLSTLCIFTRNKRSPPAITHTLHKHEVQMPLKRIKIQNENHGKTERGVCSQGRVLGYGFRGKGLGCYATRRVDNIVQQGVAVVFVGGGGGWVGRERLVGKGEAGVEGEG